VRRAALLAATLAASALSAALATAAHGHAILERTDPARGVTVERQPNGVVFEFNEPVEGSFGAVRVFDARGKRVDDDDVVRPRGQDSVGVGLDGKVPDGTYTATYRVISADAHPISGGFVFSIGAAGVPGKTVSELTAASEVGKVTDVAFGIARGATYAAIALAIGAFAFLAIAWLPALRRVMGPGPEWLSASERFARRLRILVVAALVVGMVSEAAQIVLQGATAAGMTFWSALDPDVIDEVLQTRFGTVHALAFLVFIGALVLFTARVRVPVLRPATVGASGLAPPSRARPIELAVIASLLGFLAITPALSGHASTQDPSWLLIPTDLLHVLAMSVWVGGLVVLLVAVPAATRALEPADRTRLLAAVLMRFSPMAFTAVIVIVATGLVQSYVHVRSISNLTDTAFGRAVLIKMGLMVLLIGLGAYNQRGLLPRLRQLARGGQSPYRAGIALRRSIRAEVALLVGVLGVTAALVSYAPAVGSDPGGPFADSKLVGPFEMQVTVDPAELGRNEMHLYIFRSSDGTQFNGTKQLRIRYRLPDKNVGPLAARPTKAGPGHYVVPAMDFGIKGDWDVKFTGRVSEFDQYETTFEVPIR
jgi:copper transport protein